MRMDPEVDADHGLAFHRAAGFLEYFTDHRLLGRFVGFNVSTGLRQYALPHGVFFN